MALTRSALRERGITEKEVLDYIMEEHGNTVEAAKEKAEETTKTALQKTIDGLQRQIDDTPKADPDGKDWKSEHDALQKKYDIDIAAKDEEFSIYKSSVETEKSENIKRVSLRKQLEADGANPKLTTLLEREFDLEKIEISDGKIKDWDALSKTVKETYADMFGTVKVKGVTTTNPPAGADGKADYVTQLEAARKSGNTQDAVRIKTEAAKEGVYLI